MTQRRVTNGTRITLGTKTKAYAPVVHYYGGPKWPSCGNNKGRFAADLSGVTCKRCLGLARNRATEVPGPRRKPVRA